MLGAAIAAQALADAGRRRLPTEQAGPRPGGVRPAATDICEPEIRSGRAGGEAPARAERP